jgi:hypothetical protein
MRTHAETSLKSRQNPDFHPAYVQSLTALLKRNPALTKPFTRRILRSEHDSTFRLHISRRASLVDSSMWMDAT